jgi:hypothetical protein
MTNWSDIQGTPMLFSLFWVDASGGMPPPKSHEVVGIFETLLFSKLPANVQSSVKTLLSTPLDSLFDQIWSNSETMAQTAITQGVQSFVSGAYNVVVHLPAQGTLRAATGPLSSALAAQMPPGTTATQLTLSYLVPGVTFSYSVSSGTLGGVLNFGGTWTDPSYNAGFDGELELDIAVPSDPTVPLAINGQFHVNNINGGPSNVWAWSDAISTALWDLFTFQWSSLPSGNLGDSTVPLTVADLPALIGQLSTGFSLAATLGFTQLAVRIDTNPALPAPPGNTVEFDLTHPADPGPQLAGGPAPSFFHPGIGLSAPAVPAGSTVDVTGVNFPTAPATQLEVRWNDTTTGSVTASEIMYGECPALGVAPPNPLTVQISRSQPGGSYVATGLTPGAIYGFLVRDLDLFGLAATAWSVPAASPPPNPPWSGVWTFLETQQTEQVLLVLSAGPTNLGSATLTAAGTFSAPGLLVPSSVPPGHYTISALLSGQELASKQIQVLAQGVTPPASLQRIDPTTGLPYDFATMVVANVPVTLHGQSFTPGPVTLWVDAIGSGTKLTTVSATPSGGTVGGFTTTVPWPFLALGPHEIIAVEGAEQASTPVFAEAAAQ